MGNERIQESCDEQIKELNNRLHEIYTVEKLDHLDTKENVNLLNEEIYLKALLEAYKPLTDTKFLEGKIYKKYIEHLYNAQERYDNLLSEKRTIYDRNKHDIENIHKLLRSLKEVKARY